MALGIQVREGVHPQEWVLPADKKSRDGVQSHNTAGRVLALERSLSVEPRTTKESKQKKEMQQIAHIVTEWRKTFY